MDVIVPPHLYQKVINRWYAKLTPGPAEECWMWRGARTQYGYGYMAVVIDGKRRQVLAHRVCLLLKAGIWPPGKIMACHTCDQRLCNNPDHIYFGDAKSNCRDLIERKRYSRYRVEGCEGARRSMPAATAKKIIELYFGREGAGLFWAKKSRGEVFTVSVLSQRHCVPKHTVRRVIKRALDGLPLRNAAGQLIWKEWSDPDKGQGGIIGEGKAKAKWTAKNIGQRFGLPEYTVMQFINGRTYAEIARPKWSKFSDPQAIRRRDSAYYKAKRHRRYFPDTQA